jgi:hypothetical protein
MTIAFSAVCYGKATHNIGANKVRTFVLLSYGTSKHRSINRAAPSSYVAYICEESSTIGTET